MSATEEADVVLDGLTLGDAHHLVKKLYLCVYIT